MRSCGPGGRRSRTSPAPPGAVTNAWALPRKVPLCSPGRHLSHFGPDQQQRHRQPEPEIDFDSTTRSGTIPAPSKLKKVPVRPQPACMSSTISSAPCRAAIAATRRSHSARRR